MESLGHHVMRDVDTPQQIIILIDNNEQPPL
jgi:hypothetical protein